LNTKSIRAHPTGRRCSQWILLPITSSHLRRKSKRPAPRRRICR
jgi:hypothetical protein